MQRASEALQQEPAETHNPLLPLINQRIMIQQLHRPVSSAAWRALARCADYSSSSTAQSLGILEIREYTLHPVGAKQFMQVAADNAALRKQLLPFLG